jgi:hypothetical protein
MLLISLIYWHCSLSISQGELIDRIEYHVESSRAAVESGRVNINIADTYRQRARKVTCGVGGD